MFQSMAKTAAGGPPPAAPVSIAYIEEKGADGSGTSDTWSNADFGTDEPGRYTAVAIWWAWSSGNPQLQNNATIGGRPATIAVSYSPAVGSEAACAIIIADTDGLGQNGNVVVNFTSNATQVRMATYKMLGNAGVTPHATNQDWQTSTTGPLDLDVNVEANGGVIALSNARPSTTTTNWASAPLTEDVDFTTFVRTYSAASGEYPTAQTPANVAPSLNASNSNFVGVSASWSAPP